MGNTPAPDQPTSRRAIWILLGLGAIAIVLLFVIRTTAERRRALQDYTKSRNVDGKGELSAHAPTSPGKRYSAPTSQGTPEQVVAGMVAQIGRSRREIARAMGRKAGKPVPEQIEKFFDAIESGNW